MTIYKLERENTAQTIIKRLPMLWHNINYLVSQLRKTSRTYSTEEIIRLRQNFVSIYDTMNNFNVVHGTWFAIRYPEFATALTGAITSLQNINTVIMGGLQANYWDAELNAPVVIDIAQTHRNALADSIEVELES